MSIPTPDTPDESVQAVTDLIALAPAAALAATLDRGVSPAAGQALPPLWHWIYFWWVARQSDIGADGHPAKGGFLPDLGLPRRMAAGGRLVFHRPLPIGAGAERTSRVIAREEKTGRSGRLAFVTVEHRITSGGELAILEAQDIVYRGPVQPGSPTAPRQAPEGAQWRRTITPDEVLLFRYSALTLNGHRIHYDRSYARDAEGYPDLVVHGPLIATLLLEQVAREMPSATVLEFAYKAVHPTFLGHPFHACARVAEGGKHVQLWAENHEGALTMSATAVLA